MPRTNRLNKKAIGWPYIVALVIGLLTLLMIILLITKGRDSMIDISNLFGDLFG